MASERERLLARRKNIDERLADLDKAEKQRREKEERRKAELAGRAVLKRARKDQAFARELHAILDAEITGVRLRALFDLPVQKPHGEVASPGAGVPPAAPVK